MSVPFQKIVKIEARPSYDLEHKFTRIHLDALQQAMINIKGESLKLWLYLYKNIDNYQLELSQKDCEAWGLKKDAYYTAVNKLIELRYLTPIQEGSNIYTFSEFPKDKILDSEKPKSLSENQKSLSEKTKNLSEKPCRNTTNTTINTTTETTFTSESFEADASKSSDEGTPGGEVIKMSLEDFKLFFSNEIILADKSNFPIVKLHGKTYNLA